MFKENSFWREILCSWSKINFKEPTEKGEILNQLIWLKSGIKVQNRPICWKQWVDKSIMFISDVWDNTRREFKNATDLGVSWLDIVALTTSIPIEWKTILKEEENIHSTEPDTYTTISKTKQQSRIVYNRLIYDESAVFKYYN